MTPFQSFPSNARLAVALALLIASQAARAQGILITQIDPACTPSKTEDRTEQLREALASPKVVGRKVVFPAGVYCISGPILSIQPGKKLSLVGEGIERTKFLLIGDSEQPIMTIRGQEADEDPFKHLVWLSIDEIEFDGGGFNACWLDIEYVAHSYFHRCRWHNTKGSPAIRAYSWWDTTLTECHFTMLDEGVDLLPVAPKHKQAWCNNIVFDNCRFENIKGAGVKMGKGARKNRILSCKFDRVAGNCIDTDGMHPNIIAHCQFTHCGPAVPKQALAKPASNLIYSERENIIDK